MSQAGNSQSLTSEWPPAYTVRKSKRARRASLSVSKTAHLECVVPYGFDIADLDLFIEKHRAWIEKQFKRCEGRLSQENLNQLPGNLPLRAIEQDWQIDYVAANKRAVIRRPEQQLVFMGDINNHALCKTHLIHWLKLQAKQTLIPWIEQVSAESELAFNKVIIRAQKTRWGSCSTEKNINLNFKLLFLPPELVKHIMIHELCHTLHMNHSKNFWREVGRLDPNWRENEKLSRKADKYVPLWIDN